VTPAEKMELKVRVAGVFRPGTPIDNQQLFAGRIDQINDVLHASLQPGRHVIMFGERGVGKTSLARVISEIIKVGVGYKLLNCGTINCDVSDNFNSLWRKIFRELSFVMESLEPGFRPQTTQEDVSLESILPNRELTPDDIRYMLGRIREHTLIVIDELDKLSDRSARARLADTIKNLSDHAVNTTLMLVGVGDTVDDLIAEHHSIERALVQVPMPRMSFAELTQIVTSGLTAAGMTADKDAVTWTAVLSQGLPHYTHSLALYSAFRAIEADRLNVTVDDVLEATRTTVQKTHTIHTAYNKATSSPQKQNLFGKVLRACALAETDELGYFTAAAVGGPMTKIMGKPYPIPNFSRHLFDLCDSKRGPILKKVGEPRRIRFRFIDPMMQPFVIIHDYAAGTLTNELLRESKGRTQRIIQGQVSSR
jgi:Cdc6-like AAA superfamily ATPase